MSDAASGEHSVRAFAEVQNSYAKHIKRRAGFSFDTYTDGLYERQNGDEYYAEKIKELLLCYDRKDKSQREMLAGQLANAIYDYYDWQVLAAGTRELDDIFESAEALIDDSELSMQVYRKLIRGLFYEKELADRSAAFQDSDFIAVTKSAVDAAAESGALKKFEDRQKIKSVFSRHK